MAWTIYKVCKFRKIQGIEILNIMINKVYETIKEHSLIEDKDNVLIGVSGGPDSVCLLHVLCSLQNRLNINKIFVVHVNHMLRGDEAKRDEDYVHNLCGKLGIEVYSKEFNIRDIAASKGISLEEAGREVRYEYFDKMAEKLGANKIAVAHNKNDQAETILLHIVRGTGLDGLKGMDYKRDKIVRPLMDIDRNQIEEYCIKYNLNPITDSSNLESIYTRNKIRLELVPFIDKLLKIDITSNLVKMSLLIKDDNKYIEEKTIEMYNQCIVEKDSNSICLDLVLLGKQHTAIQKRILRYAIEVLKGDLKGIEKIHIQDALNLISHGRTGSEIHLPCGLRIKRSYGIIKIFENNKKESIAAVKADEKVAIPGETSFSNCGIILASLADDKDIGKVNSINQNSLIQFFDYEKLSLGINLRYRKEGDVFRPYKSNGTKKLKEYFIDNKVPREIREKVPIIAMNNEVVWIIGYKISDKFKVTENTKRVLRLEYKKRGEEIT